MHKSKKISCTRAGIMAGRKVFHDLGYKMGDGVFAFWKFAHKSEPIAVYSVLLGFAGSRTSPLLCRPHPPPLSQARPHHG